MISKNDSTKKFFNLLGVCCVILLPFQAFALNTAKYAGEFLAIGVGGRALGLGGAYSSLASDVTAGYWNPAGLSGLQYPQISLMHDERFAGLENYDYAGFALPIDGSTTLALSVIRLGADDMANTQDAWTDYNHDGIIQENERHLDKITYFNAADWAIYFSYARRVSPRFSYGVNLKYLRRQLGTTSANGIGFDIAAQYSPAAGLRFAANLQDITTTLVAWSTGRNELISPTLKLGSAYVVDAFQGEFSPVFDIDIRFENRQLAANAHLGAVSLDFHEGLEYNYQHLVALRAGYSDIGSMNVGAGVHLPKFDIDYSFAKFNSQDQLGNTHRVSITFTFEAPQYARTNE